MRILLFCLVLATGAYASADEKTEPLEKDAFYHNSLIGRGVNLGNALDAPQEGKWGVRLEERYFDLIAKAGFTSVRIPVRWSAHAAEKPPYVIDKTFMARVDWVVDQALSRKLVAILNIHHYEEITQAPAEHKERFLALWKQIADHYKKRSARLYFEPMNEPCKQMTSDLWNEYVDEAIQVIRQSNPTRAIVVGPTRWNSISELKCLELPRDDSNIIVTFHYYQPFKFTHQGAEWVGGGSESWVGTKWQGTEEERKAIISHLDQAIQWSKKNKRPLFMGEFGAYSKADVASRARWTSFVRSEAEKRGFSWAYWEFCAGFGVYDRDKKEWRTELLYSLIPKNQTNSSGRTKQ